MYIAMNRFKVVLGAEAAFETIWTTRQSRLHEFAGFREFHLLRGPTKGDHTLYASHTVWQDEEAFRAWTRSEQFRSSHRGAGGNAALYLGPPDFEGFSEVPGASVMAESPAV